MKSKELHKKLDEIASKADVASDEFKKTDDKIEFQELFEELYKCSLKEMYLWQYAPFEVYKHHFESKKKLYFEKFPDALEKGFYIEELEEIEENYYDEEFKIVEPNQYIKTKPGYYYRFFPGHAYGFVWIGYFNKTLMQNIEFTQKKKETFLKEKIYHHENIQNEGFQSKLTNEQIKSLYDQMEGKYFKTSLEFFITLLTGKNIPIGEKLVWVLTNQKGEPHKTALREFFILLNIKPTQRKINDLITDENGNEIILPKPKRNEFSNYYAELEKIINSL